MLIENTYSPLIHLSPDMIKTYLYVISFQGVTPVTVTFYNKENHLLTDPLIYQNGIAIFECTGPQFDILFALPENTVGDLQIQEGLLPDKIEFRKENLVIDHENL